jgi:hypothetical protein
MPLFDSRRWGPSRSGLPADVQHLAHGVTLCLQEARTLAVGRAAGWAVVHAQISAATSGGHCPGTAGGGGRCPRAPASSPVTISSSTTPKLQTANKFRLAHMQMLCLTVGGSSSSQNAVSTCGRFDAAKHHRAPMHRQQCCLLVCVGVVAAALKVGYYHRLGESSQQHV